MKLLFFSFLVGLSLGCAKNNSAEPVPDEVLPTGVAASGQPVYTTNCQSCHGASAGGGSGPDIRNSSAETTKSAVRLGRSGMSAYSQNQISSQQLADLIAYIDTL